MTRPSFNIRGTWSRVRRALLLASGGVLGVTFADSTLDYIRAQRLGTPQTVALQQQAPEEMIGEMSLPELLIVSERALSFEPPRFDLAASAYERAAWLEPRDGENWSRLAYARLGAAGYWTADALEALRTSYYRMPYGDRDFRKWRLRLVDHGWSAMPADLREAALREARTEAPGWLSRSIPAMSARLETPAR